MEYNYDAIYFPTQGGGGGGGVGPAGPKGDKGEKGDKPNHAWNGTKLSFELPDGTMGADTDLVGPAGAGSTILAHAAGQPTTPINIIEFTTTSAASINGTTLTFDAPNRTADLHWSYANLADAPSAVDRIGSIIFVINENKYYRSNDHSWQELVTQSGGGGGGGDTFYVGMYKSLDDLRAAVPAPVVNKSFGFVTNDAEHTNTRYMFYSPHPPMRPDWNVYRTSDSGGFRLDPNPPVLYINYFYDINGQAETEKMRDDFMTSRPEVFNRYKNDSQLLILMEWDDRSTSTPVRKFVYQNWHKDKWINTFGDALVSWDLSAHSISELKDGSRVKHLEDTVVTKVECIGQDSDVDLCEGIVENNTIKLSKLRNKTSRYFTLAKDNVSKAVEVGVNHTWRGVFDTLALANAAIPESERLHKETTIGISEQIGKYKDYVQLYYWDTTTSGWSILNPSGVLPAAINTSSSSPDTEAFLGRQLKGGNYIKLAGDANGDLTVHCAFSPVKFADSVGTRRTVKELKKGANIDLSIDSKGVLEIKSIANEMGFKGNDNLIRPMNILASNSKYAEYIPSTESEYNIVRLPTYCILDANGRNVDEFKELMPGKGITITEDATEDGRFVISATGGSGSIDGSVGGSSSYIPIMKIKDPSRYSTITNNEMRLHRIEALDSTGTSLGIIKHIQQSDNINFTMEADVLKISAIGGGGSGSIQAKVGTGSYSNIDKINVSNQFATINGSELNLPVISAESSTGTDLGQIKNIKAGGKVVFNMGTGADAGVLTLAVAAPDPVIVGLNDGVNKTLTGLTIRDDRAGTNTLSADGVLSLFIPTSGGSASGLNIQGIKADNTGVTYNQVTDVKFDGNTVIVQDDATKVVTITNIGGGGVLGRCPSHENPTSWVSVDRIDVLGDPELSSLEEEIVDSGKYTLSLNMRGITATGSSVDELNTLFPSGSNLKRLGIVSSAGSHKIYYCASGGWTEVNAAGGGGGGGTPLQISVDGTNFQNMDKISFGRSPNAQTSPFFKVELNAATKTTNIEVNDPIITDTNAGSNLENEHPAATTPKGSIALQDPTQSYTTGTVMMNNGTQWCKIGYFSSHGIDAGCSGDHLQRLNRSYPMNVNVLAPYTANAWKYSGMSFANACSDTHPLAGSNTNDVIIHTLNNTPEDDGRQFIQRIYDLKNGKSYLKYHNSTFSKDIIDQISGLSDKHFAIYIPYSDVTGQSIESGRDYFPMHVYQDNQAVTNEVSDGIEIVTEGDYTVTACITLSGRNFVGAKPYNMTVELIDTVTSTVEKTATINNITAKESNIDPSYYYLPAQLIDFKNVIISSSKTLALKVRFTPVGHSSMAEIRESEFDPFKNYLVIEPTDSNTRTGVRIAKTLRNTLGGFSYQEGTELRVSGKRASVSYYDKDTTPKRL